MLATNWRLIMISVASHAHLDSYQHSAQILSCNTIYICAQYNEMVAIIAREFQTVGHTLRQAFSPLGSTGRRMITVATAAISAGVVTALKHR